MVNFEDCFLHRTRQVGSGEITNFTTKAASPPRIKQHLANLWISFSTDVKRSEESPLGKLLLDIRQSL